MEGVFAYKSLEGLWRSYKKQASVFLEICWIPYSLQQRKTRMIELLNLLCL